MQVFDFADPNMVTGKRTSSSVPTQALYMLNNSFIRDNSMDAAKKLIQDNNTDNSSKIDNAYKKVLGRMASPNERQIIQDYLMSQEDELNAWGNVFQSLFSSIDFRFVN